MKLLILGASGFIGNACFNFFSKQVETTGIDFTNIIDKNILVDYDFSLTKKIIAENNFDVLINCAGSANIQQSFDNSELDFELNTALVKRLLDSIKENSIHTKFINLSSAAVYGNPKSLPIKETATTNPLSPYGKHKLQAENFINTYFHQHGVKGLALRIFSAYGVGLRRQFFYDLSSKFNTNSSSILLQGSGNESRDFINILDILHAIKCIIINAPFNGEVYNLANGEEIFINEVAERYAKIYGYRGEIKFNKDQFQGYPINWKADISKIKALGFSSKIPFEDGLSEYAIWIKKYFEQ